MTAEELKAYWIVVTESGASWIGKYGRLDGAMNRDHRISRLVDAYVFRVQAVDTPHGPGMHRSIWPLEVVCGHPSLIMDTVEVVAATGRKVADLDEGEQAELLRMMQGAEQIRAQARAQKAGIVLAGGMPRPS